jgi:hypothetical protein
MLSAMRLALLFDAACDATYHKGSTDAGYAQEAENADIGESVRPGVGAVGFFFVGVGFVVVHVVVGFLNGEAVSWTVTAQSASENSTQASSASQKMDALGMVAESWWAIFMAAGCVKTFSAEAIRCCLLFSASIRATALSLVTAKPRFVCPHLGHADT